MGSGTNLTAANHVVLVHPMDADSREEAVAFEMQAIGRVKRPGQTRKIHIWRFVTVGTIEEEITQRHQKELWERQQSAKDIPKQLCPVKLPNTEQTASEDETDGD